MPVAIEFTTVFTLFWFRAATTAELICLQRVGWDLTMHLDRGSYRGSKMLVFSHKLCAIAVVFLIVNGCSKKEISQESTKVPAADIGKPEQAENSSEDVVPDSDDDATAVAADDSNGEIDIQALRAKQRIEFKTTGELKAPVRLEADGQPIDIALQQSKAGGNGHAGPAIADFDGDGDNDLIVGDFPGYFWLFENEADDTNPTYVAKGKVYTEGKSKVASGLASLVQTFTSGPKEPQAASEAAKTPVY